MKTARFVCYTSVLAFLFAGCSKPDPLNIVKNGALNFDKSVTVGNALDNYKYFGASKWNTFEDSQRRTIVEFRAPFLLAKFVGAKIDQFEITSEMLQGVRSKLRDSEFTYVAQFKIGIDGTSFELAYSATKLVGTHPDTGKQVEKDVPDENFQELKRIYQNQPAASVFGVILDIAIINGTAK